MLHIIPRFDLQKYNTLAVPATAAYFAEVRTQDDLLSALAWNKGEKLPLLILGGGSNIVLAGDFHGLVLKIAITGIEQVAENDHHYWIKIGAGENWHQVVQHCLNFHYWGLENLSLIPGTAGAAPIQNIGAYGVELKDVFSELQAIQVRTGLPVTFDRDACHFGYRDSVFKNRLLDQYIITSITLRLDKQPCINIRYPALQTCFDELAGTPTPRQISQAVCAIRKRKLPAPEDIPNVGSFFKNPIVTTRVFERLKATHPKLVGFGNGKNKVKLAAGWMIEATGWRGTENNGVAVHQHQALVVVNPGRKPGGNILQLASNIAASVKQTFDIDLEIEPRIYP